VSGRGGSKLGKKEGRDCEEERRDGGDAACSSLAGWTTAPHSHPSLHPLWCLGDPALRRWKVCAHFIVLFLPSCHPTVRQLLFGNWAGFVSLNSMSS
jgi:hypothetical protein